jgi:glycosyltransferase involved in cell wall biosynthesis
LATGFSPSVLVPQGGETAKAVGPYYFTDKKWYKTILKYVYRPMFEKLLANVDEVWGLQKENKRIYTRMGLDENKFNPFQWIPVDTKKCKPNGDKVEFETQSENDIVIGTFRRLRGELVLDTVFTFLDAIEDLSSDRKDFHVILGGIDESNNVTEKIYNKLSDINSSGRITTQELVPKDKMPMYYRSLDIYYNFTFPGNPVGTLGTGPKEALASGCAFVTPKGEGIQYEIEDHVDGIITENNSSDIRDTIEHLIDNPKKREMLGKNGRDMVVNRFSYKQISKDSYENMINLIGNN